MRTLRLSIYLRSLTLIIIKPKVVTKNVIYQVVANTCLLPVMLCKCIVCMLMKLLLIGTEERDHFLNYTLHATL